MLDDNGRQPQGRNEGGFLDGVGEGEVIAAGGGGGRGREQVRPVVRSSCLIGVAPRLPPWEAVAPNKL